MPNTISLKASDGTTVQYVDEIIGVGGMKDVYFSPDRSYVVAFYRAPQNATSRDRLETIVGRYRAQIFEEANGEYWKDLFCWPTKIVESGGKLGFVAPAYKLEFKFQYGSRNDDFLGIKGKEKEGKWFASAHHRSRHVDARELGDWRSYFKTCIKICRAVHRMHAAGLAHSDLSYKNVLIDPSGGNACIIDIDGLVVPGKFPPDVIGTADFFAPEVIETASLKMTDPRRCLPRIETDRHALSVLIYLYLFYRHPLAGGKVHDKDPAIDENLAKGKNALFIEHPTDASNRPRTASARPSELPWADITKRPYSIAGPYLKELFDQAFITGLHNPSQRPSANDWLTALVKTVDLMQPCANPSCEQKWYVFENKTKPVCPFCDTPFKGDLPILNLYSSRGQGKFRPDNHRLMIYRDQYLYLWHADRRVFPSERLTSEQKKPVGYFVIHQGRWTFINQRLKTLKDLTKGEDVAIGGSVQLVDGQQLLLSADEGGRLVQVQMVQA